MARAAPAAAWRTCLLGSLALHGGLLLMAPLATGLRPGGPAPGQPRALTVRQIDAAAPALATLAAEAPALQRLAALPLTPLAMATMPAAAEPVPPQLPLSTPAESGEDAVYLPRRQLDEPPRALTVIDLRWPEDGPAGGSFSGIASLFIDEDGVVQRVRLDEAAALPDSLAAVVQDAFLHARFSPGLRHGRPVRSWIRIEVSFEAPGAGGARGIGLPGR